MILHFSMILHTEILSTKTLDILKQIIFLKPFHSVKELISFDLTDVFDLRLNYPNQTSPDWMLPGTVLFSQIYNSYSLDHSQTVP